MKTTSKTGDTKQNNSAPNENKTVTNPKKPNNDPDQTPDREVENVPKARPSKNQAYGKSKIGFKK